MLQPYTVVRPDQMAFRKLRHEQTMAALCAACTILVCAARAHGQTVEPRQTTPTAEERARQTAEAFAKLLDPSEYGRAFNVGAQAEFVAPAVGVSSVLLGYDAVFMQVDLSLGLGVGDELVEGENGNDAYVSSLRFAFPIHRGIRADFSLLVGGGATIVDKADGGTDVLGAAVAGAKFRVFMTPNVAVAASAGLAAAFRGGSASLALGARPLGSAAVVYFFR